MLLVILHMKSPKDNTKIKKSENSIDFSQKPKNTKWKKIQKSLLVFGMLNLLWFIFRTGTKPSRIVYPCQRAALKNISISFASLIPVFSLSMIWLKLKTLFSFGRPLFFVLLVFTPISSGIILQVNYSYEAVNLDIKTIESVAGNASDIFIVNGPEVAHVNDLIDLMNSYNLSFYQSNTEGDTQGPDGLIASADVVLLKVNCQWDRRGGTNTDMLKELIQAIVDHPDGFNGEIIVADNGQGRGSLDWSSTNSEFKNQSAQDVVDIFSSSFKISTYLWDYINAIEVDEYSLGDINDGYILYDIADPETDIFASYPKFQTDFGTNVSFKEGIWNGLTYEKKLKVINLPVLKSHSGYGVTATLKNYMGVQSEDLANGHNTVATGGMGTLMVECGLPTLNIIDAIWINANPESSLAEGPYTSYSAATRVDMLIAGLDPVALDYWSAKNILMPAANLTGHTDCFSLDPDSSDSTGLNEAFGVWLNRTRDELIRAGYNVTTNTQYMNIYANSYTPDFEPKNKKYLWISITGGSIAGLILAAGIVMKVKGIKIKELFRKKT